MHLFTAQALLQQDVSFSHNVQCHRHHANDWSAKND